MKKIILVMLALAISTTAKDVLRVEVASVHTVTHDDQSTRAIIDKGLMGSAIPTRQVESANLNAIINGEHVVLNCEDSKGCESPALGTYDGEMKRSKWVKLTFNLPLSQKPVTRWYKIGGSW